MNMGALKGEEMTGTDAEACAYLYTASLTIPIGHDWTQIYLYIANQVYGRHRAKESGAQMPEDILVEVISDYQMGELRRLEDWLYGRRVRARQEGNRAESWQRREEDVAKKKAEQPALFEF